MAQSHCAQPVVVGPGCSVVAIFELLALFLIPPALAVLRQATRKSKPAANHLLARLWRDELPARVVILSIYPITLAVTILAFLGEFWKLADDIPPWHRSYYSAVVWISTWILVLTGSVITLHTLHRARTRRPWGALSGQLCVVLLSGCSERHTPMLTPTLRSHVPTAPSASARPSCSALRRCRQIPCGTRRGLSSSMLMYLRR